MEKDIRVVKNVLLFMAAVLGTYLLSLLSSLLIPLALALFMAMLLQPAMAWMERKQVPSTISLIVVNVGSLGILGLVGLLVYRTGKGLYDKKDMLLDQVSEKISSLLHWFNDLSGLEVTSSDIIDQVEPLFSVDWLVDSYNSVIGAVGNFTGLAFMTILYFVILLGGMLRYEQYLHYLEAGTGNNKILDSFEKVKQSVVTYTKVKFLISLATGTGYWLICWSFGIQFSLFWGFLAFILNFIPTFGSIIATIPPLLLGLVLVDISSLGLMAGLLFVVQTIMGNIVEPRLMGDRLSLNTITVLLGLVFWGYVWGITGMILSVPLLVLVKVTLAQIPDADLIVRLMGAPPKKGETDANQA